MNTTALAYMGDAVYEVYIRQWAMASGQPAADKLHAMAVPFVKASGQAQAVRELMKGLPSLREREITGHRLSRGMLIRWNTSWLRHLRP